MKRERRSGWLAKAMVLGAGPALAVGLGGGMLSPALAQTGSAVSASLPTACPGLEALVSDEVDGPDPWGQGEVIKFATSTSQGTLTNNLSPLGTPNLDSPEDMAFDLNGNVVTADLGLSGGDPQVVRVDRHTGVRTLIASPTVGSGPALDAPSSIAVERTGNILVVDLDPVTLTSRLVRITPTGARSVLSSNSVGAGPALTFTNRVRVLNGVIYLLDDNQLLSVDAITGTRTLISGGTAGGGPAFVQAQSVTTGVNSGSLMVLDQDYARTGALIRVDLPSGYRTEEFSNAKQNTKEDKKYPFDNPYDVVRDACDNSFYVLHTGGNGALGNVLRINGQPSTKYSNYGDRTLFATYSAPSTPSNYSLLMRPLILAPLGGGTGGGGGGGGL